MQTKVIQILVLLLLLICSYIDIRKKQVSIRVLAVFGVIGTGVYVISRQVVWWQLLMGIGIGFMVMAVSKLTRGGIGIGDGGLLCVTGLYLGFYQNLELLFIAFVLAAICSMGLLIVKKAGRKTEMPFVPFLFVAYIGILAI